MVAYFEELLAGQLAGRRESGGSHPSSAFDATGPAASGEDATVEEEVPAPSPATSLHDVFSGLPLGSSRAVGPSGPAAPSAMGLPPSSGRPGDGLRILFGAAAVDGHAGPSIVAPLVTPATIGVAELDRCLGAGFSPGLWFVTADVTADATAFLEAVIWEAATRQRPVLYVTPAGGVEAARRRFRVMLGHVLDGDRELDSILRRTVLRHVRFVADRELVDSVIADADPVGVFLRDLESATAEPTARGHTAPVVAIDDLGVLLRFLGAPSKAQTARALEGMNAVLRRQHAPGLIIAGSNAAPEHAGSGRVELHRCGTPSMQNETMRVDAHVVDYSSGGQPGTVRLTYYRSAGMFAAAH